MKNISKFPASKKEIFPGKGTLTRLFLGVCVEVHFDIQNDRVLVRDTKDPDGHHLEFFLSEWQSFIKDAKTGFFDLPRELDEKADEEMVAAKSGIEVYAKKLGVNTEELCFYSK